MAAELVHVGYALMLCALIARDILWLRAILVCAQFNLCLYALFQHLAGMAFWNGLFVVINVVWVLRILHERRAVQLPAELRELHARNFSALTPPEFLRVWALSEPVIVRDAQLIRQGEQPGSLYFLISGEAVVIQDGRHVARLRSGHFAAEMSLLTGGRATADVIARGELSLRRWPLERLNAIRAGNPALWSKIQSVLGHDLVEKIKTTSKFVGADSSGGSESSAADAV
jgi:CRP-like cAMP-binding protein